MAQKGAGTGCNPPRARPRAGPPEKSTIESPKGRDEVNEEVQALAGAANNLGLMNPPRAATQSRWRRKAANTTKSPSNDNGLVESTALIRKQGYHAAGFGAHPPGASALPICDFPRNENARQAECRHSTRNLSRSCPRPPSSQGTRRSGPPRPGCNKPSDKLSPQLAPRPDHGEPEEGCQCWRGKRGKPKRFPRFLGNRSAIHGATPRDSPVPNQNQKTRKEPRYAETKGSPSAMLFAQKKTAASISVTGVATPNAAWSVPSQVLGVRESVLQIPRAELLKRSTVKPPGAAPCRRSTWRAYEASAKAQGSNKEVPAIRQGPGREQGRPKKVHRIAQRKGCPPGATGAQQGTLEGLSRIPQGRARLAIPHGRIRHAGQTKQSGSCCQGHRRLDPVRT